MSHNVYGYSTEMNRILFSESDTDLDTNRMEFNMEIMLKSKETIQKSELSSLLTRGNLLHQRGDDGERILMPQE